MPNIRCPAISLLLAYLSDSAADGSLAAELRLSKPIHSIREASMAHFERIRDVISGPFSSDVIGQRMAAGWQLVSIEWRRELPDSETPSEGAFSEDIPYGLRISDDCQRLEIEP